MSYVDVKNIVVLDNPARFLDPFRFDITFECSGTLNDDLEWKVTYVGSAENQQHDQVLDDIFVGPVPLGTNRFTFECDAPDVSKIPEEDIIGVTAILITCAYMGVEFIRVGYYVNVEYGDEALKENPPAKVRPDQLMRNIMAEQPRVTRFPIDWENPQVDPHRKEVEASLQQEGAQQDDDALVADDDRDAEDEDDDEEDDEDDPDPTMEVELGDDDGANP